MLHNEHTTISYKDITDLKATRAVLASLECEGFRLPDSPYEVNHEGIYWLDSLVKMCRQAEIYYTITIRSGPGRVDVWKEGAKLGKSTIWTNPDEQALYASIAREIAERYYDDTLFVGLAPILEPNPFFDQLYITPEHLRTLLSNNNVDVNKFQKQIIDSVRKSAPLLPLLIQNVAYSSAEFFSLIEKQSDSYCVYEFHCYRPIGYANNENENTATYPGMFISATEMKTAFHDKDYFREKIFFAVRDFQSQHNVPVFLGEFGIAKEQNGGAQLIRDMTDICIEQGWHFAYWVWRERMKTHWHYENRAPEYMEAILESFVKGTNSVNDTPDARLGLTIAPNPAHNFITLKFNRECAPQISVYNTLGIQINNIVTYTYGNEKTFDISSLTNGVYFISVKYNKIQFYGSFIKY